MRRAFEEGETENCMEIYISSSIEVGSDAGSGFFVCNGWK